MFKKTEVELYLFVWQDIQTCCEVMGHCLCHDPTGFKRKKHAHE